MLLLTNWYKANKLLLNVNKTVLLKFWPTGLSFNIQVSNTTLSNQHFIKFLGVMIDDKLTWNAHLNKVYNKLLPNKRLLMNSKNLLPEFCLRKIYFAHIYVMPPQSWGDRSDTKHSKCLLLGGRRLNQLTLIPKPKGSGGARAAMAQVGPANNRNDTKRCLPIEATLRPGEAVPW